MYLGATNTKEAGAYRLCVDLHLMLIRKNGIFFPL
jgi:hypothetical protein